MKDEKKAFIVQTMGYWGRGKYPYDAAVNCKKAGAQLGDLCILDLFVGDDMPSIQRSGMIVESAPGTTLIPIGQFTLGQLLRSKLGSQS